MEPTISLSARKVFWVLLSVALLLAALCVAVVLYKATPGAAESRLFSDNPNLGSLNLFDLKKEQSFGTWYTAFLLLSCSALAAVVSSLKRRAGEPYVNHWRILSLVFLYLSIDEGVTIHEKLGPITRPFLRSFGIQLGGLLNNAWVIPAAVLLLVFVVAFLGFFFRLPRKQQVLFLVAGLLYVGGAMGLEMVNALVASIFGEQKGMVRIMIPVAEESLEMLGIVVFAYALLSYMGSRHREVRFRVEGEKPDKLDDEPTR
ncbi:hypothetical protein GBA65_03200 [Rubrobacter marinus]|uniref:Uncharacterized protein n=1 Tax=Rubrobacter marinus TaxID=2653852 RepID=A0A6G8PTC3_9ACTN|nr:hypothetical protein [Rubrobacter marinus]QIN77680.1 hypothetical protein GBA65_03200 [Rubrobacter marinus]